MEQQATIEAERLDSPLNVSFRFEPHSGLGEHKIEHRNRMEDVFRKGERNVLFIENSQDDYTTEDYFRQGFDMFPKGTRFSSAFAYVKMRSQGIKAEDISKEDVYNFVTNLLSDRSPQYYLEKFLTADKLEAEGYDIDFVIESPKKEDYNSESDIGQGANRALNNPEEASESDTSALASQIYYRNQAMIGQIEEIRQKAESNTNVYVSLGVTHNTLVLDLPEDLKKCVMVASTDDQKYNPKTSKWLHKLYEKLYKESNKNAVVPSKTLRESHSSNSAENRRRRLVDIGNILKNIRHKKT